MCDQLLEVLLASGVCVCGGGVLPHMSTGVHGFALVLIKLHPLGCRGVFAPPGWFSSLARSFRILLLPSRVFVVTLSLLSSGDLISVRFSPSPKSLVKILSSAGCWANPCGLPLVRACGLTVSHP